MLGRCLVQPVMRARCLASPAAVTTSRRALTNSSRSYWLSEKGVSGTMHGRWGVLLLHKCLMTHRSIPPFYPNAQLYPLMAITAGAVALGAWYSTYYEFSPPETK